MKQLKLTVTDDENGGGEGFAHIHEAENGFTDGARQKAIAELVRRYLITYQRWYQRFSLTVRSEENAWPIYMRFEIDTTPRMKIESVFSERPS